MKIEGIGIGIGIVEMTGIGTVEWTEIEVMNVDRTETVMTVAPEQTEMRIEQEIETPTEDQDQMIDLEERHPHLAARNPKQKNFHSTRNPPLQIQWDHSPIVVIH